MSTTEQRLEKFRKGLQAVADLMGESDGVAGLHRNGDLANWDELLTGPWLEDYHEAMNELIDMQHEAIERDRIQHEIKMTDDPLYAAHHKRMAREFEIAEHGINEQ